ALPEARPWKEMPMSSPNNLVPHALPWLAALALALGGCATTQAPSALVDARRAYVHAHDGPAGELVPAQVLAAQQALARAEQAFVDAPDSPLTRDLAYLAQRRAEIAEAEAALATDRRDKTQAQADLVRLQADRQARTQAELSETRQELA